MDKFTLGVKTVHTTTNSEALTGEAPALVTLNGIPFWKFSGRTFPLVAGAEDPPGGSNNENAAGDPPPSGNEFDKDRALSTIRVQREKELKLEAELKELRPLKALLKQREDADKSELEKTQAELAAVKKAREDAEANLRRMLIAQAIERAAVRYNARDPEVIAKIINMDALTLDDSGAPTNADDLVKTLLKEKTYLVNSEQPQENGRSGVPATPRSSGAPGQAEKVAKKQEQLAQSGNYAEL